MLVSAFGLAIRRSLRCSAATPGSSVCGRSSVAACSIARRAAGETLTSTVRVLAQPLFIFTFGSPLGLLVGGAGRAEIANAIAGNMHGFPVLARIPVVT
jgi:hypothetical protein